MRINNSPLVDNVFKSLSDLELCADQLLGHHHAHEAAVMRPDDGTHVRVEG